MYMCGPKSKTSDVVRPNRHRADCGFFFLKEEEGRENVFFNTKITGINMDK